MSSFHWDDSAVLLLIEHYQECELLWNPRNSDFKNRIKRNQALKHIASIFDIDSAEIERKLKNLSSHFFREQRKFEESKMSGSGRDDVQPPKWFAYKALSFLKDRNKPVSASNSENTLDAPSTSENIVPGKKVANFELITVEPTFEPTSDQETPSESKPCIISLPSSSSSQGRKPIKRKSFRRSSPYVDNSLLNAIQRLENRVSNIIDTRRQETRSASEDEFHIFALSVAAQLRQLPLHVAIATQSKIQTVLTDARLASILTNTVSTPVVSVKIEDTSNID